MDRMEGTFRSSEFDLYDRAFKVLDLIAAEFDSDPMSVQCFDLRVVNEAKLVVSERRRMERKGDCPPLLTKGRSSYG